MRLSLYISVEKNWYYIDVDKKDSNYYTILFMWWSNSLTDEHVEQFITQITTHLFKINVNNMAKQRMVQDLLGLNKPLARYTFTQARTRRLGVGYFFY